VSHDLTVGFDLDLTLINSRPGIEAVYRALGAEAGVPVDVSRLEIGPPLEPELAKFFPADHVPALADRYRALYPSVAIEATVALPGAYDALAAVRKWGGRIVVITSKFTPNARLHLDALGLDADDLIGSVYRAGKSEALRACGASAYVGDFEHDMRSARAAGVTAVGVLTGPSTSDQLRAAGADVILDDLTAFPDWLSQISVGQHRPR
jgi:phosphoglycolate phosphatase